MLFQLCPVKTHQAWGSMEKVEPRFPWFYRLQTVLWQGSRMCRVYTDIKIACNTKINHIMVSFTDHYNCISIDRLPLKTKIGKVSWYCNNFLFCKLVFSSATKNFLFSLKKQKITILQQGTGGNTLNFALL